MKRKSLDEVVYQALKAAIDGQRLLPGAPLPENDIAELLGVSRTPVRAAFRRLASEGLVVWERRKGASVVCPTAEEVRDVFAVRRCLESMSAQLAASRATEDDVRQLEGWAAREKRVFIEQDRQGALVTSRGFHEKIAQMSGNSVLASLVANMMERSLVYLAFYDPFGLLEPQSPGQHDRIIAAIRSGDPEEARMAMEEHLQSTEDSLDLDLASRFRATMNVRAALAEPLALRETEGNISDSRHTQGDQAKRNPGVHPS